MFSFDSTFARNAGSVWVCATRPSVAFATASSNGSSSLRLVACGGRRGAAGGQQNDDRGEPCGEAGSSGGGDTLHLHSLFKNADSSAVNGSSEAFCRISLHRAWVPGVFAGFGPAITGGSAPAVGGLGGGGSTRAGFSRGLRLGTTAGSGGDSLRAGVTTSGSAGFDDVGGGAAGLGTAGGASTTIGAAGACAGGAGTATTGAAADAAGVSDGVVPVTCGPAAGRSPRK